MMPDLPDPTGFLDADDPDNLPEMGAPAAVSPQVEISGEEALVGEEKARDFENRIFSGAPFGVFQLSTGAVLRVYPKVQKYFYLINAAYQDYQLALATLERRLRFPRLRFWLFSLLHTLRRNKAIDRVERAKYRLIRLIFVDPDPERHCDLSVRDFESIPHDMMARILLAYQEANDPSFLQAVLDPTVELDKKKESLYKLVALRRGLRL